MNFFLVELFGLQLDLENFLQFIFLLWTLNFFLVELFGLQLDLEIFSTIYFLTLNFGFEHRFEVDLQVGIA